MGKDLKTLILGELPDDYSPEKYIVLGPFSFVGKEHIYQDWETLEFYSDPFQTPEEIRNNSILTCDYTHFLITKYTEILNIKFSLNYSEKFWKIIIFPWLHSVVETTFERQLRVISFIERNKNKNISIILVKDNINWNFKDSKDFVNNGIFDPLYNEWLFSRIFQDNIPPKWNAQYVDRSRKVQISRKPSYVSGIHAFLSRIKKYIYFKIFHRVGNIYGFTLFDRLIAEIILRFKTKKDPEYENIYINIKKENNIKWWLDFDDLFWKILPDSIRNLQSHLRKFPSKILHNKIFLGTLDLTFDDNFNKIKFGLSVENQGKLISVQHGGHSYGSGKIAGLSNSIEFCNYSFITWGWRTQEDYKGNFIPMPSPLLSRNMNKHIPKGNKIIMVSTHANLYSYRIGSSPQAKQCIEYRKNKLGFITTLNYRHLRNLYYRPYFNNYGCLDDEMYLKQIIPDLNVLKGNLNTSLYTCNLLIMDHPGTTFNLAMAAKIPTICFWNKNHFPLSKQSDKYFQSLKEVGVLFETGEDAAHKVNIIVDDVQSWWNEGIVQEAVKDWTREYAYSCRHWRRKWMKFIINI